MEIETWKQHYQQKLTVYRDSRSPIICQVGVYTIQDEMVTAALKYEKLLSPMEL